MVVLLLFYLEQMISTGFYEFYRQLVVDYLLMLQINVKVAGFEVADPFLAPFGACVQVGDDGHSVT